MDETRVSVRASHDGGESVAVPIPVGRQTVVDASMVVLGSATMQAAAVLRDSDPLSMPWLVAYAVCAFGLLRLLDTGRRRSMLDDVRGVLSATSLAMLVILVMRVHVVADAPLALESVRQWAFVAAYVLAARVGLAGAAPTYDEADADEAEPARRGFELRAAEELARARRHARPVSLLVVDAAGRAATVCARRRGDFDGAVAALSELLRLSDVVGIVHGRLLVVLPETGPAGTAALLERFREALEPELRTRLVAGHASFPDEEVTLVGLHERALERALPLTNPPRASTGRAAAAEVAA